MRVVEDIPGIGIFIKMDPYNFQMRREQALPCRPIYVTVTPPGTDAVGRGDLHE